MKIWTQVVAIFFVLGLQVSPARAGHEDRVESLSELTPVTVVHPRFAELSEGFKALGGMHETHGVIWSAISSVQGLNQSQAQEYCRGLGARLPSHQDFIQLSQLLGSENPGELNSTGYDASRFPGLRACYFWSDLWRPPGLDYAVVFNGSSGLLVLANAYHRGHSVICVYP
jgi:hypothetical protein